MSTPTDIAQARMTVPNSARDAATDTGGGDAVVRPAGPTAAGRSVLRTVAVPTEHGGWGLTLEPGLLGLLVAPSTAGICLAGAAMIAFTARTPLRIAAIDIRRGRRLERTRVAALLGAIEVLVLAALVVAAVLLADGAFWAPAAIAIPFIAVEASYDVRSRGDASSRELAGAIGVCSVAAMIVLADNGPVDLAAGVWLVLAARAITSIPWVRAQIGRLHGHSPDAGMLLMTDMAALAAAGCAVWVDHELATGGVAVIMVIATQRITGRGEVPRPAVTGMRQMAMGFGVVLAAALGVIAPWS